MFTALYKPGQDLIDGHRATCQVFADKDLLSALADGWVKTLAETVKPVQANPIEPVEPVEPEDNLPPSREELELKATDLGIKFDGRTSDKKLLALIEDALK